MCEEPSESSSHPDFSVTLKMHSKGAWWQSPSVMSADVLDLLETITICIPASSEQIPLIAWQTLIHGIPWKPGRSQETDRQDSDGLLQRRAGCLNSHEAKFPMEKDDYS